jgi:hypothetical protein
MSEYANAVAARAGVEPVAAEEILAARGIREWVPAAPPARLRIERISFSGFKDISGDIPEEPFSFEWDVPRGVSALASNNNSAGKTSVIEIIRWLLSGRSSVDNWVFARVREAQLIFSLGGRTFTVAVQRDDPGLSGRLLLGDEEVRRLSDDSFEPVLEELMLAQLGLERIGTFQRGRGSERGKVTESGWPFLIDALYVRPSELATVIGGVSTLAGQLLQVYLALPWYDTLLQARAAASEASQAAGDVRKSAEAQAGVRAVATDAVRKEFADAQRALAAMDDEQRVAARLRSAVDRAAELGELDLRAAARVQAARAEVAAAEEAHVAAQRTLHNVTEREAAGRFFRALEPRACPRCATVIGADRREHEAERGVCSVCDREAEYQPDPTARTRAEAQVASTQEAVDSAEVALAEARAEHDALTAALTGVQRRIEELSRSDALARRSEQQALVHRLQGRLEERADTERQIERSGDGPDPATAILQAAVAEAERLVAQTTELFSELNREILDLGNKFGISGLTEVNLTRGAHLPVVKEGTKYNYGQLPQGDRLRLKVAVVIALLRVGERRGAGRHPGLLFVDSPGAEEVAAGSLEQMIAELDRVAGELDLQIVVGTARLDDVQHVLDADRLRTPEPGSATLW